MNKFIPLFLLVFLCGCSGPALVHIGPDANNREITFAKNGTPATIIDKQQTKVIKTDDGRTQILDKKTREVIIEGKVSAGDLSGLDVIDDATLQYYRTLDSMYGKDYLQKIANQKLNSGK